MTIFLIKLTLAWGFFALLYALLLRQETFFRANRAYLLSTAILGILLALPLDWTGDRAPLPVVILPSVTVGLLQAQAATALWDWLDYLWFVYWAGAGLGLLRLLWGIFKVLHMASRGSRRSLPDGCILVETAEAKAPFSFFRWIFVPEGAELSESCVGEAMIAHERAHVRGRHSADVLLAEMLCVAFWFHPLAHWYRRSLRTMHEYLADFDASRLTGKKQYGLLLIGQARSEMSLAFVNHFFQSPLRQRIVMLTRKASPALSAWKYGLTAPVFALLFLFACQKTEQEAPAPLPVLPGRAEKEIFELTDLEQQPEYPGGMEALVKFLSENIRYPAAAMREKAEGVVLVGFIVDEEGRISQVESVAGGRKDFRDEAIRVVQLMPAWAPGMHNGKAVKVKLTLPVRYRLN